MIASESFGSLIAELRRAEANGHNAEQLIPRVVAAGGTDQASDFAATLRNRVSRLAEMRSGGTRRRARSRLIAGLVPEAGGFMPADMAQTLRELKELIERRVSALADAAITEQASWTRSLGPQPRTLRERAAWRSCVVTVAAYRDRYDIAGPQVLGSSPSTQLQRLDRERAAAAILRAQKMSREASPVESPGSRREGIER